MLNARRTLSSFNAKKFTIRLNRNVHAINQFNHKQLFHSLRVVGDKHQQDNVEDEKLKETAHLNDIMNQVEKHMKKQEEYSKNTKRPYLFITSSSYILVSALLIAGVLIIDSHTNALSSIRSDNIILDQEESSESEFPVVHYLKNLQNDIKRFPALYTLIGLNAAVFVLARRQFSLNTALLLEKHFVMSVNNVLVRKRYHTLLTSAFTHFSTFHFGFNMFALYKVSIIMILY
jgi:hypothetical protein